MPYTLTYFISLCYITHVAGCLCFWSIRPTERWTESDSAPASYLDCSALKSWPTKWLSWLRLFLGSHCLFSQCQESTSNLAITASFHVLPVYTDGSKSPLNLVLLRYPCLLGLDATGVYCALSMEQVGTRSDILVCCNQPWSRSILPVLVTVHQFEQRAIIMSFAN
jgi:hypothetical protein